MLVKLLCHLDCLAGAATFAAKGLQRFHLQGEGSSQLPGCCDGLGLVFIPERAGCNFHGEQMNRNHLGR
ncbi:MAG: hypothetical protein C0515_00080 [Novosphingobium sp.]|nr:hypothetical protein [Novosphingobium sp.]